MGVVHFGGSRKEHLRGQFFYDYIYDLMLSLPKDTLIVTGMATGADMYAYRAAKAQDRPTVEFPVTGPEWDILGKRAGRIRNRVMAFYLECTDGESHLFINNGTMTPGTDNMKLYLETMSIPHTVHDLSLTLEQLNTPVTDWRKRV